MRHSARSLVRLIAFFLLSSAGLIGATIAIDFDSLSDNELATNQYTGLTFANTIALSANGTLNTLLFVPRSDSNVASDFGGPIEITFDAPVTSFSGYFTYATALVLQAFDIDSNLVDTTTSAFSDNTVFFGEPFSSPNELLALSSALGIARIAISGDPGGNSFTLDDLTAEAVAVPEPGTVGLLMIGLLLGAIPKLRVSRLAGLLVTLSIVAAAQPASAPRDLTH